MPPETRRPSISGAVVPRPSTIHATAPTTSATPSTHNAGRAGWPVRSLTARRQRDVAHAAAATITIRATIAQFPASIHSNDAPSNVQDSQGPVVPGPIDAGNALSTTPVYSRKRIASSGTLRTNST